MLKDGGLHHFTGTDVRHRDNDAPDGDRNDALKYLSTRPLPPRLREEGSSVHLRENVSYLT
jgi:hypothetical protein